MKMRRKIGSALLALFVSFLAAVSSAEATNIIVNNTLKGDVNAAVTYCDPSGNWTSLGWFVVKSGEMRKFDTDTKPNTMMYVHAYGLGAYCVDKRTGNKSYDRWVSRPDKFSFVGDKKPASGKNLRTAQFYACTFDKGANAYVYRIDTLVQPPKPAAQPAQRPASKPAQRPAQTARVSLSVTPDTVLIGGRMTVKIAYSIQRDFKGWWTTLNIYDSDGKLVKELLKKELSYHPGVQLKDGSYSLNFNAKNLDYDDYTVVLRVLNSDKEDIAKTSKTFSVLWR
jgi:hypothetical protein